MKRFSDGVNGARRRSYSCKRAIALAVVFLFLTSLFLANSGRHASANTSLDTPVELTVTRNDDRGGTCVSGVDCSLREAVYAANATAGDERITFAPNVTTVTLVSGEMVIGYNGSLRIDGPGADRLTIRASENSRIFYTQLATVTISGVTLTGGNPPGTAPVGGAIYANAGSLTLDRVVVKGNQAYYFRQGFGGGVYYNGGANHLILASTFSADSSQFGGGIFVASPAVVTVVNSTFSGNGAFSGGAIACGGRVDLRNVTITNNWVGYYGFGMGVTFGVAPGVYLESGGSMTFGNSILSENKGSGPSGAVYEIVDIVSVGQAVSLGHNQVGSCSTCAPDAGGIVYAASDRRNVQPRLTPLGMYGGPTPTHGIMRGSPVVNAGDNSLAVNPLDNTPLTQDQRGHQRIAPGFGGVPTVDIGAFEFRAFPAAVVTGD